MELFQKLLNYKKLILYGLILLFAFISFYLLKLDLSLDPWNLGDWLINYQDGGFKRRGLSGSFFFMLQDFTGFSLIYLVFTTQIIFYLIFFICFYKLIIKKYITSEYFLMIFSPVTLLFFFNNIRIIGRKEIIIFALFSINAHWHSNKNYSNNKLLITSSLLFFFSFWHELIIFYVPYFIILHLLHNSNTINKKKNTIKIGICYFIPVLVTTLLIYFLGTEINNGKSLEILSQRGIPMKGGIFAFNTDIFLFLKNNTINYLSYLLPFSFGCLLFFFHLRNIFNLKILFMLLLAFLFSLPLFFLAIDWGRWISIHFILILILSGSKLNSAKGNYENYKLSSKRIKLNYLLLFILFFINLSFKMPYCCTGIFYKITHFNLKKINTIFNETLLDSWF